MTMSKLVGASRDAAINVMKQMVVKLDTAQLRNAFGQPDEPMFR
jgi:hypothetical protein